MDSTILCHLLYDKCAKTCNVQALLKFNLQEFRKTVHCVNPCGYIVQSWCLNIGTKYKLNLSIYRTASTIVIQPSYSVYQRRNTLFMEEYALEIVTE